MFPFDCFNDMKQWCRPSLFSFWCDVDVTNTFAFETSSRSYSRSDDPSQEVRHM